MCAGDRDDLAVGIHRVEHAVAVDQGIAGTYGGQSRRRDVCSVESKEAVMAGTNGGRAVPVKDLILWPAVITLAVTLLRLAGELMGGSDTLFNRAPGGAGAIVGIVWLVPVFGYYFGHRLARLGVRPGSTGRLFGFARLTSLAGLLLGD